MALQAIDGLVDFLNQPEATTSNPWDDIIGDRTAETMKNETACKFALDKPNSNANQRLTYIQTLFAQINCAPDDAKADEKTDEKTDQKDNVADEKHQADIWKPIDCILDITRGSSKPIGTDVGIYSVSSEADMSIDCILDITRGSSKPIGTDVGIYSVSSEADMSLDCNFELKSSGKWYYEVELVADPSSYKDINIGFCNSSHSSRNEVGFDGNSYGYNGVKQKIFNMDTSYGKTKWKQGDILGFAFDGSSKTIEFYLNGDCQGAAFENIDCVGGLFAGFTLQRGQNGVFIFEESKLKQKKPDGYECIKVDSEAKQAEVWELEGNIVCENVEHGIKITANEGFPTAILKCAELELGAEKKYYFEFELNTAGCMQLGFADCKFEANANRGEGIGDDSHSWGCDLLRLQKWGIFGSSFCNQTNWKTSDIIGCCLDFDMKCISYFLNGKDLGIAFKNINVTKGLYPAISIRNMEARNKMIELYQKKRAATGAEADELKMPEPINYFNLIFSENGYKYKPNGYQAMTENLAFKAMNICNGLKEYSYEQYKEDYSFMDTVIMLSRNEEFDEIAKKVDKDTLIVVDFWATWCGPCIYIAPHYHAISHQFPEVVFLKADVDKLKKFSQEKNIQCMPTFKFFKDGQEVHKIEGADKDAIIAAVKQYSAPAK